ncbi:MAG: DUF1365 domain-containing protein [Gammaproteobacteria bacterium]
MAIEANILLGEVRHKRLFPKLNEFRYKIYNIGIPLSKIDQIPIAYNRKAIQSFYDRDHGDCDGSNLEAWARKILSDQGLNEADGEIFLVCMPRIIGYVFNPVSFWFCFDKSEALRAVLCEVHNTFGEKHTYLCVNKDYEPITSEDTLEGQKLFHVSPFLEREGHYKFKFNISNEKFAVSINYFDSNHEEKLLTSLSGKLVPMTETSCRMVLWKYPLVTVKAIVLIHWQALKLVLKGVCYIKKPLQKKQVISSTNGLK